MAEEIQNVSVGAGDADSGGSIQGQENGAGAATSWRDSLTEDYRNDPSLATVPDLNTLAKNYLETKKLVGKKGIIPPKDTDPDEKWAEFYAAAGRPEKPENYEIAKPDVPEGMVYSEEFENAFREHAHKMGLSQKQVKGLYDWFMPLSIQGYEDQAKAAAEAETSLKAEWGGQYDENLKVARLALRKFASKDDMEVLESGAGNDPRLVRLFFKVGKSMAEDSLVTPDRTVSTSLDAQIEAIEKNPGLLDPKNPEHKKLVQQRDLLYKRKYPERDKA